MVGNIDIYQAILMVNLAESLPALRQKTAYPLPPMSVAFACLYATFKQYVSAVAPELQVIIVQIAW